MTKNMENSQKENSKSDDDHMKTNNSDNTIEINTKSNTNDIPNINDVPDTNPIENKEKVVESKLNDIKCSIKSKTKNTTKQHNKKNTKEQKNKEVVSDDKLKSINEKLDRIEKHIITIDVVVACVFILVLLAFILVGYSVFSSYIETADVRSLGSIKNLGFEMAIYGVLYFLFSFDFKRFDIKLF